MVCILNMLEGTMMISISEASKKYGLSKNQIENLMSFISLNPDLEDEFYTFINLEKLPNNNIKTDLKFSLKKSENDFIITKENFENCCIAKIEGDLTKHEEEIFDKYKFLNIIPVSEIFIDSL